MPPYVVAQFSLFFSSSHDCVRYLWRGQLLLCNSNNAPPFHLHLWSFRTRHIDASMMLVGCQWKFGIDPPLSKLQRQRPPPKKKKSCVLLSQSLSLCVFSLLWYSFPVPQTRTLLYPVCIRTCCQCPNAQTKVSTRSDRRKRRVRHRHEYRRRTYTSVARGLTFRSNLANFLVTSFPGVTPRHTFLQYLIEVRALTWTSKTLVKGYSLINVIHSTSMINIFALLL